MAISPKIEDIDYIQFLLAAQTTFTCTEAARCSGELEHKPAHDAFCRLLTRRPPDTEALWQEVAPFVHKQTGLLVLDDSTLDKPYARFMDLVSRHWSGKHKRVVWGINLLTMLWTDGGAILPCDCRIYEKPKTGKTKNDSFAEMLQTAKERGFAPRYVCFDSWYSSLDNLKLIRSLDWRWLTCLEVDRQVNPDGRGNERVDMIEIPEEGRIVHLKGYGMVRVFREVLDFDLAKHWATNDLEMTSSQQEELGRQAWAIETYHRGLKQHCGVEGCQARKADAQKNHILLSIRAFLRLELRRLDTGQSWFESKLSILRKAVGQFLATPMQPLARSA